MRVRLKMDIQYGILTNFQTNQYRNAHAFANYCVIRDLSKAIFNKNYITEISDWISIDSKLIKEKSKILFYYNTNKLDPIGNNLVTEFIK